MRYLYTLLVVVLLGISALGQYSIGGGFTTLNTMQYTGNWTPGLNFSVELPNAEDNSFLGKLTLYAPKNSENVQEIYNPETDAFEEVVTSSITDNIFSIDGGTRRYFFNTYDLGPAMYVGLTLKGTVNTFKFRDNNPNVANERGYAIIASTYGYVGFKYQLPYRSAIFIDAGFDLGLFNIGGPSALPGFYFTTNIGYRWDIF